MISLLSDITQKTTNKTDNRKVIPRGEVGRPGRREGKRSDRGH